MPRVWPFFVLAAAGCVEGFRGSNVQVDLSPAMPVQASPGVVPGPGELPANVHFRLYAIDEIDGTDQLFEIQRFEVHRIVDTASPCFIDAGEHVPYPGLHVADFGDMVAFDTGIADPTMPPPGASEADRIEAATAQQRMMNVAALGGAAGIKVVSSASETAYPAVDATCDGAGIPPPGCIEPAHNARRLATCQAFWDANPDHFEGTDRVLTSPLNGTTFGMVVGVNPISPAPLGGAQFFVDASLAEIDAYAIYYQTDGVEEPGTLLLSGRPVSKARGVLHVAMSSPPFPNLGPADLAICVDLGEDDVHF
ncbi:MAG: hypothetical protein WKG01_40410 [Kofleriaceae bacterium]